MPALEITIGDDASGAPGFGGALASCLRSTLPRGGAHDRAARAAALDDGLLSEEVDQILAGRRMVEAFPVRRGETPPAYAVRAVAEMMVAYLV